MKNKFLKGIVWAVIIILIIWVIYKLVRSQYTSDFFPELNKEIREEERKLNAMLAELKAAITKQAILDRVANMKMDIITYCILCLSISISLISGYHHQTVFIGFYITYKETAKDLLILLVYIVYKKIPGITMLNDLLGAYLRNREYRRHGFDPECLVVLNTKIETVRCKLMELKSMFPAGVLPLNSQNITL